MINDKVLNYIITRSIGKGGMAEVFEAEHQTFDDRKVAIKILDPVLARNEKIANRFANEAKIMAKLEHKNIVKVMDFEKRTDMLAIVMERLVGKSLTEYLREKGKLKKQEAINIFKQALNAFEFAHKKGVVHRDVKPSNIFVETHKNNNVKILDFGIAKLLESNTNDTNTGAQMGTPIYMSPEQVKDSKNIDQRSDIYSLGVVLYYMLAGKPAYDSTSLSNFDIYTKIVNEPMPELPEHPGINAIIKKATAKNPAERYQTCKQFEKALTLNLPSSHKGHGNVLENSDNDQTLIDDGNDHNYQNDETLIETAPPVNKPAKIKKTTTQKTETIEKPASILKNKKILIPIVAGVLIFIIVLLVWQPWKTKNNDIENDITENVENPDEKIDFDNVMLSDNTNDFRKYLIQYPDGNYTEEVKNQLNKLENDSIKNAETIQRNNEDKTAYENAKKKDTKKAYQKYLNDYPEGQYVAKVKKAIEKIKIIPKISYGSFYDSRNGKTYKTVKIGNQTWMAENLAYKPSSGNYWVYDNNQSNVATYGYLYDWETAKKVCPNGWHLPSKSEFETLLNNYGGVGEQAYKALIKGGSSGFESLFSGWRNDNANFCNKDKNSGFWSATGNNDMTAWYCNLNGNDRNVNMQCNYKNVGRSFSFSVRCLRD